MVINNTGKLVIGNIIFCFDSLRGLRAQLELDCIQIPESTWLDVWAWESYLSVLNIGLLVCKMWKHHSLPNMVILRSKLDEMFKKHIVSDIL